jgi:hypothetical protein
MNQLADRPRFGAQPRRYVTATTVGVVVAAILFVALLAFLFQAFGRYQYRVDDGVVWRIDRITQQVCRVTHGVAYCSGSVSTSTSTSLSPSTSVVTGRDQTR